MAQGKDLGWKEFGESWGCASEDVSGMDLGKDVGCMGMDLGRLGMDSEKELGWGL